MRSGRLLRGGLRHGPQSAEAAHAPNKLQQLLLLSGQVRPVRDRGTLVAAHRQVCIRQLEREAQGKTDDLTVRRRAQGEGGGKGGSGVEHAA
jgi:hypothetical protein